MEPIHTGGHEQREYDVEEVEEDEDHGDNDADTAHGDTVLGDEILERAPTPAPNGDGCVRGRDQIRQFFA